MTTVERNKQALAREEQRFYLLAGIVFFIAIGGLLLVFALTFVRDLKTLREVPDALWNFLCGTPTDNEIALPLLLTVAIVSFGISAGLQVWRWRLGLLDKRKGLSDEREA